MKRLPLLHLILLFSLFAPSLVQAQALPEDEPVAQHDAVQSDAVYDEAARDGRLQFAPCPENAALECGTLTLPVDYQNPHGESFGMAVVRAKATDPNKRIGVLLTNPGGPGSSGVDFVLAGTQAPAFIQIRERFDIFSFDVRGSHRSRPVSCAVQSPGDPAAVNEAELVAFFDDFSRHFAQSCLAQNGPFLLTMSTNTIARDMDVLRRALGERQISYVGLSFGTELGAVYASLFPKQVRAMILDAGVAPEFYDNLVEFAAEQTISFELTLHRLDRLCRQAPACRLRDTGVAAALDAVKAQLNAAPVTSPAGVVLDGDKVADIVASLLSIESAWPLIVAALTDGQGGNYTRLFQFIPFISTIPLANTAFFAIKCNDQGTRRSAADYLPMSEAVGKLTTRLHNQFQVASIMATCAAWPAADVPIIRNVQRQVANPILLLGSDFDPNTPLSWTRSLAFALGMERNIVRYQGGGHTVVTRGLPCTHAVVKAYLFDLALPATGFTCPALPIAFDPAAVQASLEANLQQAAFQSFLPLIQQ